MRYTGYRDRPQEERQVRFQNACREGHTEIAFAATGTNLQLVFTPPTTGYMPDKECDFEKEPGKVSVLLYFLKPLRNRTCLLTKMAEKNAASHSQWRADGYIDRRDAMLSVGYSSAKRFVFEVNYFQSKIGICIFS